MLFCETYLDYVYSGRGANFSNSEIATEGIKEIGAGIWKVIQNLLKKIIAWFKRILLNANYFKNAELDEQLSKDLIHVLKLCQPRTERNFGVIQNFYKYLSLLKNLGSENAYDANLGPVGIKLGVVSSNPMSSVAYTNLSDEIEKCYTDITDSIEATKRSEQFKRIQEDAYENKIIKQIPLGFITNDMKDSQKNSTKYEIELGKIENNVKKLKTTGREVHSVITDMASLLRKIVDYYTFRINLLSKYFEKAKASLKGTLNNIKDIKKKEGKSKTDTKPKIGIMKTKLFSSPDAAKEVAELYENARRAKTYEEYKEYHDKLSSILKSGNNIIFGVIASGLTVQWSEVKDSREKIPVEGRSLYHNGRAGLKELRPTWCTAFGELFPTPRVYVHIGVPLSRFGNKVNDTHSLAGIGSTYQITENIKTVYRDPEMGRTAAYIETTKPISIKLIANQQNDEEFDIDFSF